MPTIYSPFKQVSYFLVLILLTVNLSSCSKKVGFETSSIVPAARGEIVVNKNKDQNNNYKIEIQISYLAEPERLNPPKKCYVAWLESDENYPNNIGQIVGTSKLHVKFETVSATKPKRIFVTAEDDAKTQYPGNMIVLEANNL
jgi:hypothetical protein